MGRVRSGRRRIVSRVISGACFAICVAGLAVGGASLLDSGVGAVAGDAVPSTPPGSDARSSTAGVATFEAPRLQMPSVPSIRPAADVIDGGIAAAVGLALLAFFGMVARSPDAFGSRRARRISARAPPHLVVARL